MPNPAPAPLAPTGIPSITSAVVVLGAAAALGSALIGSLASAAGAANGAERASVTSLEVERALPTSTAPAKTKVLILGIDGLRPDALLAAKAPALQQLMAEGAWTDVSSTDEHTISGAGWSDFLTGTWPDKHKSVDNKFTAPDYADFPHVFRRIHAARPELAFAHYCSWLPIDQKILGLEPFADGKEITWRGAWDNEKDDGDAKVAAATVAVLRDHDPDVVFAYLGDVDTAGHAHGFSPWSPEYVAEIADTDAKIASILAAMKGRTSYAGEDWLVLVSSDHAGTLDGAHGRDELAHRTIAFIEWSSTKRIAAGKLVATVNLVDLVPTALAHLGIEPKAEWQLDGRPLLALAPARLDMNLIVNGGAEAQEGRASSADNSGLCGWRDWGSMTAVRYGSPDGFPTDACPGSKTRGQNFLCGGRAQTSAISQVVDVRALAAAIDAGKIDYTLSAWLGGFAEQTDFAFVDARFLDEHDDALTKVLLPPVTLADRRRAFGGEKSALTGFLAREQKGRVPERTRSIVVTLTAEAGEGANDGYADDLSLVLHAR